MLPPVIGPDRPLGLGSTSPRRRELLQSVGLSVRVFAPDADERALAGESVDSYLERITELKLQSVIDRHASASVDHASASVDTWLVADTVVVVDGVMLGKPADVDEARSMLAQLSGRAHQVKTRFAIGRACAARAGRVLHAETVASQVWFRTLAADEIGAYAATREGLDKAGAYAIQGIGSFAVARIDGSYSNIVGLPLCEVVLALRRTGDLPCFPIVSEAPRDDGARG